MTTVATGGSPRWVFRTVPRKYLMQRIPEIAEVDVSDPDDLIDEGEPGESRAGGKARNV